MKVMKKRVRAIIYILFLLLASMQTAAQQTLIKTNALYWATGTPNIAFERRIGNNISLDIPVGYNAWKSGSDKRSLRHYAFQPEVRWWFCKAFEGHFAGVHLHYAKYNMGNIPFLPATEDYMYKGNLVGAGLSYGFHWVLGTRWGLEADIGVGYAYMNYKKYVEGDCCAEVVSKVKKHYLGPTKLAISLIYVID